MTHPKNSRALNTFLGEFNNQVKLAKVQDIPKILLKGLRTVAELACSPLISPELFKIRFKMKEEFGRVDEVIKGMKADHAMLSEDFKSLDGAFIDGTRLLWDRSLVAHKEIEKLKNAPISKGINKLKNYESSFTDALREKARGAVPKPPSDALSFNIKPKLQDLPYFPGEQAIAQAGGTAVLTSLNEPVRKGYRVATRSQEETTQKIGAVLNPVGLGGGGTPLPGTTEELSSWSDGVQAAYADISASANDWGAISQDLTHKVFDGMTDAVVDFATTGKANFSDFAASLIQDLLRISTQQLLVNALSGFSFFGTPGVKAAKGAVIDQGRIQAFARGGVVSQPAYFGLRNGIGLMGEAGPEAIMPLRRGRGGKLGVAAEAPPPPPVNVRVVNITDPREITTAMNTGAGERVILNTIVNNHDTVRKLLRVP